MPSGNLVHHRGLANRSRAVQRHHREIGYPIDDDLGHSSPDVVWHQTRESSRSSRTIGGGLIPQFETFIRPASLHHRAISNINGVDSALGLPAFEPTARGSTPPRPRPMVRLHRDGRRRDRAPPGSAHSGSGCFRSVHRPTPMVPPPTPRHSPTGWHTSVVEHLLRYRTLPTEPGRLAPLASVMRRPGLSEPSR